MDGSDAEDLWSNQTATRWQTHNSEITHPWRTTYADHEHQWLGRKGGDETGQRSCRVHQPRFDAWQTNAPNHRKRMFRDRLGCRQMEIIVKCYLKNTNTVNVENWSEIYSEKSTGISSIRWLSERPNS